jgi:hypothetical protein
MSETRGPSRILAAGLLVLVAALGILAGIVLDRTVLRPHGPSGMWAMHDGLHGPRHRASRNALREHLGEQIAADLDLSADQREELLLVLERHELRLARALADARPRLRQVIEEIHHEIRVILTPRQREHFDSMWMTRHRELFPDEEPEPQDTSKEPDG